MKTGTLFSILYLLFQFNLNAANGGQDYFLNNTDVDFEAFNLYDPSIPWVKFYQKEDPAFFLSNFEKAEVIIYGNKYPTSEHAYQAQKFKPGSKTALEFLDPKNSSPSQAYRLGQLRTDFKYESPKEWKAARVRIMYEVVYAKFNQNPELKEKLFKTEKAMLVEWAKTQRTGHDVLWGINRYSKKGKNHLGKILMVVREQLKGNIQVAEVEQVLALLKEEHFE